MAITFTPKSGSAFTIGGQTTASNGIVGPFANLSISREVRRQDSLILGEKYSITITGTALITGDHMTKGERQNAIFEVIDDKILRSAIGVEGTLDIDPYGSGSNTIQLDREF